MGVRTAAPQRASGNGHDLILGSHGLRLFDPLLLVTVVPYVSACRAAFGRLDWQGSLTWSNREIGRSDDIEVVCIHG